MDSKEFEKLITFEELAPTDNSLKFLLKAYLEILLKGRKTSASCFMYSVGRIMPNPLGPKILHEDMPLKFDSIPLDHEIAVRRLMLIEMFEKMKEQKEWTVEEDYHEEYNENGERIWEDEPKEIPKIVSKSVHTHIRTIYYIDDKLKIKDLRKKRVKKSG